MSDAFTRDLARFVAELEFSDIPTDIVDRCSEFLLDGLGNQIAGSRDTGCRLVVQWVHGNAARGRCTIVGEDIGAPPAFAAFANGTMAHAVEMDDAHRDGLVKVGSVVVPATVAYGEARQVDGRSLITAMVAGYETMIRLGLAANPSHRRRNHHSTGTLGTFAAAAAAARLEGLSPEQTASAFGVAGTQASGLAAFLDDPNAMIKAFNAGKAAMNGLLSVQLTASGFTGPTNILEGREGFLTAKCDEVRFEEINRDLGSLWRIREMGYKPHAACRYAHGPIDAAHDIVAQNEIATDEIATVFVRASTLAVRQASHKDPSTLVSAQGSTPYSVALSLVTGKTYLNLHDFEQAWNAGDRQVMELAQRVEMVADEDRFGLMGRASEVELRLKDGRSLLAYVELPKGEPENPLTAEELRRKFEDLAVPVIGPSRSETLARLTRELPELASICLLTQQLGRAAGADAASDAPLLTGQT